MRGVAAPISAADLPPHFLGAPLVHLAPIAGEVDPQIAHSFKDATVLLTLQGWLRRWDADGRVHFKRWYDPDVLKSIDIVVFSEEDIVESPQMEQEFAGSVKHLFVTRAEKGGTYYHNGAGYRLHDAAGRTGQPDWRGRRVRGVAAGEPARAWTSICGGDSGGGAARRDFGDTLSARRRADADEVEAALAEAQTVQALPATNAPDTTEQTHVHFETHPYDELFIRITMTQSLDRSHPL